MVVSSVLNWLELDVFVFVMFESIWCINSFVKI